MPENVLPEMELSETSGIGVCHERSSLVSESSQLNHDRRGGGKKRGGVRDEEEMRRK